jgi:hypothetical protein
MEISCSWLFMHICLSTNESFCTKTKNGFAILPTGVPDITELQQACNRLQTDYRVC